MVHQRRHRTRPARPAHGRRTRPGRVRGADGGLRRRPHRLAGRRAAGGLPGRRDLRRQRRQPAGHHRRGRPGTAGGRDQHHAGRGIGAAVFYQKLHQLGILEAQAPATLRELRVRGQRGVGEIVDRYQITCRPVRGLLVDYLRERQPALDYTSLKSLAYHLAGVFWADIEHHHPGIDSLHLPADVARAWKQRLQTKTATVTTATGEKTTTTAERLSYRECLTPVRAVYLDLAHWAIEDPARWAQWVAPCPVGDEEVSRRKSQRRRKARMDARTRERLPVLPALVRTADQRRDGAAALLAAARGTLAGRSAAVRPAGPAQAGNHQPAQLRQGIEDNLRSLAVGHLAAVNLRLMDDAEPDQRFDDQLAAMVKARDNGLIGGVGLSNVTRDHLLHALSVTDIACVQNPMNLADRASMPVLEECYARGIAFVPFFPLGSAFTQGNPVLGSPQVIRTAARLGHTPAQVALAWLLSLRPNVLLIPGTSSIRHLQENMAVANIELDAEARELLAPMA